MSDRAKGPTPEWTIATRFNDPSDYDIPDPHADPVDPEEFGDPSTVDANWR